MRDKSTSQICGRHGQDNKETSFLNAGVPGLVADLNFNFYTLKTAGSILTLFLVNYAPTKIRGQNYNPFCSQNNPFHGYFLTPFSKLVHSWLRKGLKMTPQFLLHSLVILLPYLDYKVTRWRSLDTNIHTNSVFITRNEHHFPCYRFTGLNIAIVMLTFHDTGSTDHNGSIMYRLMIRIYWLQCEVFQWYGSSGCNVVRSKIFLCYTDLTGLNVVIGLWTFHATNLLHGYNAFSNADWHATDPLVTILLVM